LKLLTSKPFQLLLACLLGLFLGLVYAGLGAYTYLAASLPTAEELRGRDQQIPLRVYTRNGALIAQIGEQLRVPVAYEDIPPLVRNAFLAAEDDRFFQHGGIDLKGILRALYVDISSGDFSQGGSTITQQLARAIALSADKNLKRKLQEVFLTFRMEHDFTKQQILNAYLNEIYFGQRSYGVAAAAQVYFGKSLNELTVAEAAMLAGLPQAPSRFNPVTNAEKARERRSYVIGRMRTLGMIDAQAAAQAQKEPVYGREFKPLSDVEAPYVAEMAREALIDRFGEAAVNKGYRVYTTIDGRLQTAANRAVRIGLLEYDRRHGYRGPLGRIKDAAGANPAKLDQELEAFKSTGLLHPAIVVSVAPKTARVYLGNRNYAQIDWEGMAWAAGDGRQANAASILSAGDVVYVVANGGTAHLAQAPETQGALVSIDPDDGAVVALVGGYDFNTSKYNRAIQAERQPGSGIKPFLYTAALDSGVTPASIFLDAPVMVSNEDLSERKWRPENSGGGFSGPMRLREALVRSRNLVSVRVLQGLFRNPGADQTIDYLARFGFNRADLPRADSLILGTLSAHPIEVAAAYASLANGGYKIDWYFIDRIESDVGEVVWRASPKRVCEACERAQLLSSAAQSASAPSDSAAATPAAAPAVTPLPALPAVPPLPVARAQLCMREVDDSALLSTARVAPRIIPAATAWLIDDILKDVVLRGTGRGALVLGRNDLAGKTGTTNERRDTWFNGFNRHLVASVWVGNDQSTPLGEGEEGARTAVPIWVSYMREALHGVPEQPRLRPAGLVTARISPTTGMLVPDNDPTGIDETFLAQFMPAASGEQPQNTTTGNEESIF
jgi:penicillin-binding protein 1A